MPGVAIVVCQDEEGLVFLPRRDVASLVMEGPQRCRVVGRDGLVAFRMEMPEGDWARVGEVRVNADCLVSLQKMMWSDPAGFVHVGELEGESEAEAGSAGTGLEHVLGLRSMPGKHCVWVTDEGEVGQDVEVQVAAEGHPHLILVRQGLYVNMLRLRRWVSREGPSFDLVLETVGWTVVQKLTERLGLASHSHPCKVGSKTHLVKALRWVEMGGGLDGQLRGIYANYVEPYSRVRELFQRSLSTLRPGAAGEGRRD